MQHLIFWNKTENRTVRYVRETRQKFNNKDGPKSRPITHFLFVKRERWKSGRKNNQTLKLWLLFVYLFIYFCIFVKGERLTRTDDWQQVGLIQNYSIVINNYEISAWLVKHPLGDQSSVQEVVDNVLTTKILPTRKVKLVRSLDLQIVQLKDDVKRMLAEYILLKNMQLALQMTWKSTYNIGQNAN